MLTGTSQWDNGMFDNKGYICFYSNSVNIFVPFRRICNSFRRNGVRRNLSKRLKKALLTLSFLKHHLFFAFTSLLLCFGMLCFGMRTDVVYVLHYCKARVSLLWVTTFTIVVMFKTLYVNRIYMCSLRNEHRGFTFTIPAFDGQK